jgi:hypothetical protein
MRTDHPELTLSIVAESPYDGLRVEQVIRAPQTAPESAAPDGLRCQCGRPWPKRLGTNVPAACVHLMMNAT